MTFLCALLLAPAPLFAPGPESDEIARLNWKGDRYEVDELPEELTPAALDAYRGWAAWAEAHDYELHLTDDQRVLLVQHSRRRPRAALELIAEVTERFDALLPSPEREEEELDPDVVRVKPGEEPPPPPEPEPGEAWSWKWVAEGGPLDSDTAVILQLRSEEDQASVLEKLAADFDYLRQWAKYAGNRAGFSLERPLCAAWLESAEGQEEWDPEHELINRTTQLLTLRRFGQLPFWLVQGIAWAVEWDMREALYCFPYRAEFVFESEHGAWLDDLENTFEERKDDPLGLDEVGGWTRGTFEAEPARRAFGLVHFLAEYRPETLSPFVEHLRVYRDEHGRRDLGDGSWERIQGYEVPVEEQQRALLEIAGDDVLEEATEFFWRGRRYRHPRR
jgi:hypothetical protein